jgi:methyl coenzyme M reductase beta subunit
MRKIQIETKAMKAHELCALIEASPMYNSGRRFSAEEIMRSMNRFKLLGTARVKLLLNRMTDELKLNKVKEACKGNEVVYYVKRDSSRAILSRRWARPVAEEYTPRYY